MVVAVVGLEPFWDPGWEPLDQPQFAGPASAQSERLPGFATVECWPPVAARFSAGRRISPGVSVAGVVDGPVGSYLVSRRVRFLSSNDTVNGEQNRLWCQFSPLAVE